MQIHPGLVGLSQLTFPTPGLIQDSFEDSANTAVAETGRMSQELALRRTVALQVQQRRVHYIDPLAAVTATAEAVMMMKLAQSPLAAIWVLRDGSLWVALVV